MFIRVLLYAYIIFGWYASRAQTITTFAGNGTPGYSGDGGAATGASIAPGGCAFDSHGNFYFTDASHSVVRKVTPSGIIGTVAGTGVGGYNGDGIQATNAELNTPTAIVFDTLSNMYIADGENQRIRKVDAITGIMTTVAGTGAVGYGGDGGQATSAIFKGVQNICFDKFGNLYILDYSNFRIRKINTLGIITTVAGNGISGDSGDGGAATVANIEDMLGVCTDNSGNLYFSESGLRIRKVTILTGAISTIAGIDPEGDSATGDGGPATNAGIDPADIVFDKLGNLYVAGYLYEDVRMIDNLGIIHTVAGTGVAGYNGDDIPAVSAELNSPIGLALDSCGNLYITEIRNYRIRKVAFNPYCWPEEINIVIENAATNIYPNPTYDILNIDNLQTKTTYNIVSIVGTTVQTGKLKEGNNSISVQKLSSGMYILEIVDEDGGKTVKKIIKQ